MIMKRPRYPSKFKTKRELLWYIRGLKDAKVICEKDIQIEEERYLGALYHMDFDNDGKVLDSSVQPTQSKTNK